MKIITVSREFGSGGREIGKRLADILEYDYYDREVLAELSVRTKLDAKYIESTLDRGTLRNIPVTIGRTFSYLSGGTNTASLLAQQHSIIKEIAAKGRDFVIVGRSANVILSEYNPFDLFVYADMADKIMRCRKRDENGNISDRELEKKIRLIDRSRAECHSLVSDKKWGDMSGYHLCVNTTSREIKKIAPLIAEFAKNYFTED